MIIREIETNRIAVPLKKPFKTALRTVETAEAVVVRIHSDDGLTGWGEAPPTVVITGESLDSIESAVIQSIKPALLGEDAADFERVFEKLHKAIAGNTSAKAAVDMAVYDLLSKKAGLPLYQYLGGYQNGLETDFTVSVNSPDEMGEDAAQYVENGFNVLKAGGIYQAEFINRMAQMAGIECMVGSMIETRLGISAAAHFAASKKNITRFDFDAPLMLKQDVFQGGLRYERNKIYLQNEPGLGITGIADYEEVL